MTRPLRCVCSLRRRGWGFAGGFRPLQGISATAASTKPASDGAQPSCAQKVEHCISALHMHGRPRGIFYVIYYTMAILTELLFSAMRAHTWRYFRFNEPKTKTVLLVFLVLVLYCLQHATPKCTSVKKVHLKKCTFGP